MMQHLLAPGMVLLQLQQGFVSLQEHKQAGSVTQKLLHLAEYECVCPAHILGLIKLVTNTLSGQISVWFLVFWWFFFPGNRTLLLLH